MDKRPKILIVDDEPFNIAVLEQELDDLDYDTVSAANPRIVYAENTAFGTKVRWPARSVWT